MQRATNKAQSKKSKEEQTVLLTIATHDADEILVKQDASHSQHRWIQGKV